MRERDNCSTAFDLQFHTNIVGAKGDFDIIDNKKCLENVLLKQYLACYGSIWKTCKLGHNLFDQIQTGELYPNLLLPRSWITGNCLKIFILTKFWKFIFRCRSSNTITRKSNVSESSRRFRARHQRTCKEKSKEVLPSLIFLGFTTIRTELKKNSGVAVRFYPFSGGLKKIL